MKGHVQILAGILLVTALFIDCSNGQVGSVKIKPGPKQLKKIWRLFQNRDFVRNEMPPELLRLSFHQCVGTSCNACVDPTHPENQGFERVISEMEAFHKRREIFPYMTMSDLIAFAILAFLDKKIRMNNLNCTLHKRCAIPTPEWQYWWGRKDGCNHIATKVDNTPNDFPTALMNRSQVMEWFDKDFGYNETEVTLLLGAAHAMGGAHKEFSNYDGNFTKPGAYGKVFNNKLFKVLTLNDSEIRLTNNFPDSKTQKYFQFETYGGNGGQNGILLNTEVVAAYDINLDPLEGTTCKFNDVVSSNKKGGEKERYVDPNTPYCKKSATWDVAYKYATDARAFTKDFFELYNRMLSKGHEGKLEKLKLHHIPAHTWEMFRDEDFTRRPHHPTRPHKKAN